MDLPLDLSGEPLDALFAALGVARQEISRTNRFAKMHERIAAIQLFGRIRQTDRDHLQAEPARVPMFQFQRHPRRSAFDLLQLRILIRDAFGENAHCFPGLERPVTGLESIRYGAHSSRVVLDAINRNHSATSQQPFERSESEKLHGGDEIHLARDGRADHERVGQRVRVVGREQNRSARRDALGMEALDAPKVEPQRQPNPRPHQSVKPAH